MEKIYQFLEKFIESGNYPEYKTLESAGTEAEIIIDGKKYLSFSSNNYLGLARHPRVVEAGIESLRKFGLGPGSSRILSGNLEELERLDSALAELVGMEDAISFPTGYLANLGIFKALTDPIFFDQPYPKGSSVIVSDEYNHYSIVEGCRVSYAKKVVFRHNDLSDLEKKLKENADVKGNKLLLTEGVFSMDGEITNLGPISQLAEEYGYALYVDDAHGIGVFGETGGGICQLQKMTSKVTVIMGTMDKAIGCMGGFLAGSRRLISYLRMAARPYLFSSPVPTVLASAIMESINILKGDPVLRRSGLERAVDLKKALRDAGFTVYGNSDIPVVPLRVGTEDGGIRFSRRLFEYGIFIPIVRWPAVPRGESRLRITLTASHEKRHIDELVNVLLHLGKKEKLI